jgi:EAL domain-containing protein (putative c-di-GMP-specific phosphodiesterase class I)/DNA-binding NarL/FixJ family response regulator
VITVVVVEDQPDLADAIRQTIEFDGVSTVVGVCHTLDASVEMVAALQPAMIVSDFRLPDGDSADVMQTWLASAPHVKILVVSAWTDQRSIARATRAGASGYIEKGPQLATLSESIINLMSATGSEHHPSRPGVSMAPSRSSARVASTADLLSLLSDGTTTRDAAVLFDMSERELRRYTNSLRHVHGARTRAELYVCVMNTATTTEDGLDQQQGRLEPQPVGPEPSDDRPLRNDAVDQPTPDEPSYRAEHDVSSGLHNRQFAVDAVDRALAHGEPVTLVAIELQRFDAPVSPLGDRYSGTLVNAAARRIAEISVDGDVIARIGATHLLLARTGPCGEEDAVDLCVDIVDAIGTTLEVNGITFPTAAVCGAAIAQPGESGESAMQDAAVALRFALAEQIDMEILSEPLRHSERRRLTVERALGLAVASGALELYLQPVLDAAQGHLIGYEGLSRWRHPVLGPVSPLEFIPLAERAGLMHAIGEWSLERALQILDGWRQAGVPSVPIGLNLSPTQLFDRSLTTSMLDSIAHHGAQGLIAAEIRESLLSVDRARVQLAELQAGGIRIGVDGFGTGVSALSYLGDLAVRYIKIDRSFIARLGHERTLILVRSTIEMAHALGLYTIAEGVETDEERSTVAALGCDAIQGFFTGPAQPAPQTHRYDVIER